MANAATRNVPGGEKLIEIFNHIDSNEHKKQISDTLQQVALQWNPQFAEADCHNVILALDLDHSFTWDKFKRFFYILMDSL